MDQLNYSFEYIIQNSESKISTILKADNLALIFCPKGNTGKCRFETRCSTLHIESGHCLALLAICNQPLKSLAPYSTAYLLTLPGSIVKETVLARFHKKSEQENSVITFNNSRIEFLLNELISQEDEYACTFRIHSLLLELIGLQLSKLSDEGAGTAGQVHYDKISYAKRLLEENLSHTYTIPELAKLAGTNEQYLKKYFKLYLGKTIFQYTLEVKMAFAKNLLITGNHKVSDIARMIGYKHSTHFTTAFKKYFGFIPNSLRY